jgi:hypothetical protein
MLKRIMILAGLLLVVAVSAQADEHIYTFEAGIGPFTSPPWALTSTPATGGAGDDGAYLSMTGSPIRTNPMPRTLLAGDPETAFWHGNYRAAGVTSLGVDVIVLAPAALAYDMPGSIFIYSDMDTADGADDQFWYYLTDKLPQPGEGWVSFDAPIDCNSDTAPAGWLIGDPTTGNPPPAADFGTAVQNVTMFGFYFGDMSGGTMGTQVGFYNCGMDNVRMTFSAPVIPAEDSSWGEVKALFR